MAGDRSHFYDQLRDRGLSVKKVVGISYMLTLFFVLIGISVIVLQTRYAVLLYLLAFVVILFAVSRLNMVGIESQKLVKTSDLSSDADHKQHG
jgi:purine-cytosine permease-like protein